MCEYCGCQQVETIAALTEEHDSLRGLCRELTDAAHAGELGTAALAARRMLAVLEPHTHVEEQGLFPSLADEFPAQLQLLTDEHRAIDSALSSLAAGEPTGWTARAADVAALLFDHILKEQDGVFPAALSILSPEAWERIEAIRVRHPKVKIA